MTFAIHQSIKNPKYYVFTPCREDCSKIPEGLVEELGKIKFLRNSRTKEEESDKIKERYQEIESKVCDKGFCILKIV